MKKSKKNIWKYLIFACLAIILIFIVYTLVRYPLKTSLSKLTGMDVKNCRLSLWHWGEETQITDEKSKTDLLAGLDGTLKRSLTGDWIMKSGGSDWVLKITDGKKEVQIIIYPDAYQKIKYGHYDYTLEKPVSKEMLTVILEKR